MEKSLIFLRWTVASCVFLQFNLVHTSPLPRTGPFSSKDAQDVIITEQKEIMNQNNFFSNNDENAMAPNNYNGLVEKEHAVSELETNSTPVLEISESLTAAKHIPTEIDSDHAVIFYTATSLGDFQNISDRTIKSELPTSVGVLHSETYSSIPAEDFQDNSETTATVPPSSEKVHNMDETFSSDVTKDIQNISENSINTEQSTSNPIQSTKEEVIYPITNSSISIAVLQDTFETTAEFERLATFTIPSTDIADSDTVFSTTPIDAFESVSTTVISEHPIVEAVTPTDEEGKYSSTHPPIEVLGDTAKDTSKLERLTTLAVSLSEVNSDIISSPTPTDKLQGVYTTIKSKHAAEQTVVATEEEMDQSGTTFSFTFIGDVAESTTKPSEVDIISTVTAFSEPGTNIAKNSSSSAIGEVSSAETTASDSNPSNSSTYTNSKESTADTVSAQDADADASPSEESFLPDISDTDNVSNLETAESTSIIYFTTDHTSTETPAIHTSPESNTTPAGDSICSVCRSCTNDYIDRVLTDVTTNLPPFLELPNRQGRFQLYHGKLFGLTTLKRSDSAEVTCSSDDTYSVMVPLRLTNAKAFYKWQIEMPIRTFYGDINVTASNAESHIFYYHSDGGSVVEGLKITALDDIKTEFSGMGPFNGMMSGLARAAIRMFRRSFARALENALLESINKELQDVQKYEEYYVIKEKE